MKAVFWILGTLIAGVVAVIPEAAMWVLWHMVHPETEAIRFLVGAVFFIFGGSACVGFAVLGVILFGTVTKVALE